MKDINKKTKTKLLLSFLENVPFDGWSWETLYFSAVDTGLIKSKNLRMSLISLIHSIHSLKSFKDLIQENIHTNQMIK